MGSGFGAAHLGGFAAGLLERVAVNACADGRESNRSAAILCGEANRGAISGAQQLPGLVRRVGSVNRADGMDDEVSQS